MWLRARRMLRKITQRWQRHFPAPPASAGIIFDGDEGRLSEEAFLRDFAGDLPEAKAKARAAIFKTWTHRTARPGNLRPSLQRWSWSRHSS